MRKLIKVYLPDCDVDSCQVTKSDMFDKRNCRYHVDIMPSIMFTLLKVASKCASVSSCELSILLFPNSARPARTNTSTPLFVKFPISQYFLFSPISEKHSV